MIFQLISSLGIRCEIALKWMPQNFFDAESKLDQVWCPQATPF